ncbi:MAG: hypothetical protein ACT4P7_09575 [Gemmatimonadaceae bacterium]
MRFSNGRLVVGVLLTSALGSCREDSAPAIVYAESPAVWFEAHKVAASVSPTGERAAMTIRWPLGVRMIDLATHAETGTGVSGFVDSARAATFMPSGEPVVLGWMGGVFGWFSRDSTGSRRLALPPNATPRWSSNGRLVAYFVPYARAGEPAHGIHAGDPGQPRWYPLAGRVTGAAWMPGDSALLVLTSDSVGISSLRELTLATGESIVRAEGLDADPMVSPVAVSPDGKRAYLALSTAGAPASTERHRPSADRDLDIYEIVLATGTRRGVVVSPAEEHAPAVANGQLYWTHTAVDASVVVLPAAGGEPQIVVPDAFLPSWRPDSRAIGYVFGGFVGADWVLNWDGGMVTVDSAGRPTATPQPVITGFHEDFQPVWSPNGRWIAYHSHRSTIPVPLYATPETTDDIWLRSARGGEEVRLTDYGWEVGSPEWSRDGTRLLFTGWLRPDKGEGSGTYLGLTNVDTVNGRATAHRRIPLGPIPSAEMAAFSPLSDDIAVEAIERPGHQSLWILPGSGGDPRKLTAYPAHTYTGVSWTPDAKSLVYSAEVEGRLQLFTIPVDGGTPLQLTRGTANILHPRVSPDGRHIAATRIVHRKEIRRMSLPSQ